ncbi:hypothetical protein HY733_00800 [Candidatus Uhrbacteria bacterium]|nr:hypothetical protein [Candidatus Uhrbacteria bacterium]
MESLPHALPTRVIDLSEDHATLSFEDGQILLWPRPLLPPDLALGEAVDLLALAQDDHEAERARLAKHVLNEMLKGE